MSDFRERIASARERLHATSADQVELRILREEVARLTEALTVDHLRVALACIEAIHGEEPRWDAGAAKAIRRALEATEGEHA